MYKKAHKKLVLAYLPTIENLIRLEAIPQKNLSVI